MDSLLFLVCLGAFGLATSLLDFHAVLKIPYTNSDTNLTTEVGSSLTFRCVCTPYCETVTWYVNDCNVVYRTGSECSTRNTCGKNFNITCNGRDQITLHDVNLKLSGEWYCRDERRGKYSSKVIVVITPATGWPTTTSASSIRSTGNNVKETGSLVETTSGQPSSTGSSERTSDRQLTETSDTTSNNFLFLVIGAAAGGVLLISIILGVLAVRKWRAGGEKTVPRPNHDDRKQRLAAEEELDGHYQQIGGRRESVPVLEPNPLYESCTEERGQQKDQAADVTSADVYSVVQKPKISGPKDTGHSGDEVGDVYSVVQKPRKSDTQSGNVRSKLSSDEAISDVYSVVQKPGKSP